MSAPRTPTKSATSKESEPKSARSSAKQAATPPPGSGQRRTAGGSQLGSPAIRSGATSAASPSGTRDKLNSATNKQNAASPIPSTNISFENKLKSLILYVTFKRSNRLQVEQK
jgi:hypothetical protein